MKNFDLLTPATLAEAFGMLEAHYNDKTLVLSGGTDLIPVMRAGVLDVDYLVDINNLGLNTIKETADEIIIGATASMKQIYTNEAVCKYLPILAEAARSVGAVQTRGIATMGGNIASAVPSLDSAPSLLVLDAQVKIVSATGERVVDIKDFFVGPRRTVIEKNKEILTEIIVKKPAANFSGKFIKFGRRNALSLSIVNTGFGCEVEGGKIANARGAIGACGPKPVRLYKVEEYLNGKDINAIDWDALDELVKGEISPISDIRASAEYRKDLAAALIRRSVREICGGN